MSAEAEQPELHINALVTRTGVNMGDHAQDVTNAVVVDPATPVGELLLAHLTEDRWVGVNEPRRRDVRPDNFIVLRLAAPAPAPDDQ